MSHSNAHPLFPSLPAHLQFVYTYWGPAFSYNCGPGRRLPAEVYNTDAVREKTVAYIK